MFFFLSPSFSLYSIVCVFVCRSVVGFYFILFWFFCKAESYLIAFRLFHFNSFRSLVVVAFNIDAIVVVVFVVIYFSLFHAFRFHLTVPIWQTKSLVHPTVRMLYLSISYELKRFQLKAINVLIVLASIK